MLAALCFFLALLPVSVWAVVVCIRWFFFSVASEPSKCSVAFFHPYCNAGGGGERVLWCAIASLCGVRDIRHLKVVVYCGDEGTSAEQALHRAQERFGVVIDPALDIEFVHVRYRHLLEAERYPRFTMLGQSLGSIVLAWECLTRFKPDVFIDTTGYAFTFIVAKLFARCRVACYVHYPTITSDMLQAVHERRPSHNNAEDVAHRASATFAKLVYYRLFAAAYRFVGGLADAVMVNSTWTKNHLDELWALPTAAAASDVGEASVGEGLSLARQAQSPAAASASPERMYRPLFGVWPLLARALGVSRMALPRPAARLVFPPCNVDALASLPLGWSYASEGGASDGARRCASTRQRLVVSVAQFRPEKDHALQLRAFAEFRRRDPARHRDVHLRLIGGARDEGDRARLQALRELAASPALGLPPGAVSFAVNVPLGELRAALGGASAGLHSMWNEHFGIGVVEMMAAGVITVAHDSGGPRSDIVVPPWHAGGGGVAAVGFLAATPTQYADALTTIFAATNSEAPAASAAVAAPPPPAAAGEESSGALVTGESDEAAGDTAAAACASEPSSLPRSDEPTPRASTASATATAAVAATAEAAPAAAAAFDAVACAAAARASVGRFSDEEFSLAFFAAAIGLLRDGFDAARVRRARAGEAAADAPKLD